MASQTHQLDRLGRELKCPICLSLLQQAASLTCNHTFCRSCILQSMKSKPACPICKVPCTRREVRAAPQMDSLVAIFVSMGSAAGLDIMVSQNLPSTGEPIHATTSKDATFKGRPALSNITNNQKPLCMPEENLKSSDCTFKGAIPAKKRIQVPQPSSLQGELEANRDDMHSTPRSHLSAGKCGLPEVSASPKSGSKSKKQKKRKGCQNESDASRSHNTSSKKGDKRVKTQDQLVGPSCSKQVDTEAHGIERETTKETSTYVQVSPNRKKHGKRRGKDVPLPAGSQLATNIEKGSDLPVRDDSSRRKLDPFFWLRDESSQEVDTVRGTQLTLTQSTMRPNFSDLKDSDDEFGLDAHQEITNAIGGCGSYDSDDFDWTQHPSSPELRCSPSKTQGNTKDLIIDIPLEASHPSTKELFLDEKSACKRNSQDIVSTKSLVESASKVSSIAHDISDAAMKEESKRRKSGRVKVHCKTSKAVDLPVCSSQKTKLEQQNNRAGCSTNDHQLEPPICDITLSEKTKLIKRSAVSKRNVEMASKHKRKHVQEKNVAGCSIEPQSADNQPCDIFPLEDLKLKKLSASTERNYVMSSKLRRRNCVQKNNVTGCSIEPQSADNLPCDIFPSEDLKLKKSRASTIRNYVTPSKLHKRKCGLESNLADAKNDTVPLKKKNSKDSTEPCLPACVFCGASNSSQVTGSMMYFNQMGTPLEGPEHDEKVVHVHKHCAEWAPDVYFVEDEARNLTAEAARGLKIKCFSCGKRGAALGCCLKRCRKSYHYPCARALPCKWEEDCFIMLCPEHKAEKFPVKKKGRHRASGRAAHKASTEILSKLPEHAGVGLMEEMPAKWTCSQSSKWVLCGSALDAVAKNQLATIAKVTGATISKAWSLNVTHVIAGTDLNGAARRTMKFLKAILEGKWVVKLDWLAACVEAGGPVGEEPFEIQTDIHGAIEGPKQGRLLAAREGPKLFAKLQFYFMPDFLPSYKGDLQALVVAGGGGVLHRKPVTFVDDDDTEQRNTVVVYNKETPSSDKKAEEGKQLSKRQAEAQELAAFVGAHVVSHQWILDSIGSSKVQSLE